MRLSLFIWAWMMFVALPALALADQTLFRYEGDVLPYAPDAGWIVADACNPPCSEALSGGKFKLFWPQADNLANYHHWIAQSPAAPPPTLWVEWRFRSNHPIGEFFYVCDASFSVRYKDSSDGIHIYGDHAISFGGNVETNLPMGEFQTFRFESTDGSFFSYAANGKVFYTRTMDANLSSHYLQFRGSGGCASDQIPNMVNEWDFIRYGTIGTGEQVVSTDPPSGGLGPGAYTNFTVFRVSFDQPNYVYVDDITVSVTGGIAPIVTATRRVDNMDEKTVEIVLDRALPQNQMTTFTLSDGQTTNVIYYDFRPNANAIPTTGALGLACLALGIFAAAYLIVRGNSNRQTAA